ncbi:MAG: hypothetical protein MHM6MM_005565 [Cercozoa sp. M6MM]
MRQKRDGKRRIARGGVSELIIIVQAMSFIARLRRAFVVRPQFRALAVQPQRRFLSVDKPEDLLSMLYTCKRCKTRNAIAFSRFTLEHGVVVARCDGCHTMHLLSDRKGLLGVGKSLEELLEKHGETVTHISSKDIEKLTQDSAKAASASQTKSDVSSDEATDETVSIYDHKRPVLTRDDARLLHKHFEARAAARERHGGGRWVKLPGDHSEEESNSKLSDSDVKPE